MVGKVGTGRDSVKSMFVERGREDVDLKHQSASPGKSCLGLTYRIGKEQVRCDSPMSQRPWRVLGRDSALDPYE